METASVVQWWMEGGWSMYPVLGLGILGVLAAAGALFVHGKKMGGIALVLLVGTGLLGVAGNLMNRRAVEQAIAAADPSYQATIREIGYRESMRPMQLGGGLVVTGLSLMLASLVFARRRSV